MNRVMLSCCGVSAQEVVRTTRGNKLNTSNEDDLWSGRIWTGRQAAKLGLIDSVGTMESVCKEKFGDKVGSFCHAYAVHGPQREVCSRGLKHITMLTLDCKLACD